MDFTNKTWQLHARSGPVSSFVFSCEASDIGLQPGVPPSPNTVRDPWDRRAPVFTAQRNAEQEITHWDVTAKAPDGTWVTLVVYND